MLVSSVTRHALYEGHVSRTMTKRLWRKGQGSRVVTHNFRITARDKWVVTRYHVTRSSTPQGRDYLRDGDLAPLHNYAHRQNFDLSRRVVEGSVDLVHLTATDDHQLVAVVCPLHGCRVVAIDCHKEPTHWYSVGVHCLLTINPRELVEWWMNGWKVEINITTTKTM